MSWDKLADRCQLFLNVFTHKGMLIELLKEAEEEVARHSDILEMEERYSAPFSSQDGSLIIPEDYKRMIAVFHNGNRLTAIDEYEKQISTTNDRESGTPSGYNILKLPSSHIIEFDKYPTSGEIKIIYSAKLTSRSNRKRFINKKRQVNAIVIETGLGAELNGLAGDWKDYTTDSTGFTNIVYDSEYTQEGSKYTLTGSTTASEGAYLYIHNYRSVAPLIPSQYHKDLCDYAIAIAGAKDPVKYQTHWNLWLNNLEKIKNEDADTELIHTVRREI